MTAVWAIAASAIALIALLRDDEPEADPAARSRTAVLERQLNRRIDELEERVRRTGEESDVAKLDRRLRRTEADVVDAVDGASDATEGLTRLDDQIDGLRRRMRELESRERRDDRSDEEPDGGRQEARTRDRRRFRPLLQF